MWCRSQEEVLVLAGCYIALLQLEEGTLYLLKSNRTTVTNLRLELPGYQLPLA